MTNEPHVDAPEHHVTRFQWSRLTPQQVGRYGEYFAKMSFAEFGLDVYTAEVDDKGIDFVVRVDGAHYLGHSGQVSKGPKLRLLQEEQVRAERKPICGCAALYRRRMAEAVSDPVGGMA